MKRRQSFGSSREEGETLTKATMAMFSLSPVQWVRQARPA